MLLFAPKHTGSLTIAFVCLFSALVTPAQKFMSDPLFGISYDRERIHFQRMPHMLVEHCPELRGRYVAAWTYGHFKTTDSEYFLISGLMESHADEPGGAVTVAPDEGGGVAVALQGSHCLVDQVEYFLTQHINPAKGATPIMVPPPTLNGILRDAFKRYVVAFGGRQELLKQIKPNVALPVVQEQFEIFNKDAKSTYRNKNYDFSFDYPAEWVIYEGFDRNGVSLYPFPNTKTASRPIIGVGGSAGQPSENNDSHPQTLQEDFEFHLEAMKRGPAPAVDLRIVSNEPVSLQGLPAIVGTIEFKRGNPKENWVMKEILIHTRDDSVTYHLTLICHPEQVEVLVPLFDNVTKSFRILGPPA